MSFSQYCMLRGTFKLLWKDARSLYLSLEIEQTGNF